eukprot:1189658-Prorocentrum_minimum.AAC.2
MRRMSAPAFVAASSCPPVAANRAAASTSSPSRELITAAHFNESARTTARHVGAISAGRRSLDVFAAEGPPCRLQNPDTCRGTVEPS